MLVENFTNYNCKLFLFLYVVKTRTGGGRILQIPTLTAYGWILAMYASGSFHSSSSGSNTGASGGGMNSNSSPDKNMSIEIQ